MGLLSHSHSKVMAKVGKKKDKKYHRTVAS